MLRRINLLFLFIALSCSGATVTQNPAWWGASHPSLLDGLVAYWKLDEASGTRFDSWGTNHLTDVNGVGSSDGKLSISSSPNGVNNYIKESASGTLTSNCTLSVWFFPTNAYNDGTAECVIGSFIASPQREFSLMKFSDGKMYVGVQYGGTSTRIIQTATPALWPNTNWIHYVWVMNQLATQDVYTNGALWASNTKTNVDNIRSLFFGCENVSGSPIRFFKGKIDEISIHNRALTSSEVQTLYNESKARRFPFNSGP